MSNFTKILKNTTASPISIKHAGITIAALSNYDITITEYYIWASDDVLNDITPFINSGDIVVNDGINDLPAAEGINHLRYPDFATSQRFLSEPERSNSMSSKTTQKAIEEARPDIEKDGASVLEDVDIINFQGGRVFVTPDAANRKVTVAIDDPITESLYHATCFNINNCIITTELQALADFTLCLIKSEEC